jgi:hypothetical protein
MKFETKIIKTKDWMKTLYGKVSLILFVISFIVIYFLRPGIFNRDYIYEWFGQFTKPFIGLNFIFNINGFIVLFSQFFKYKTIGGLEINDNAIKVMESLDSMVFDVTKISSVRLKYNGFKKRWNSYELGNLNYLEIVDKNNIMHLYEFLIITYKHKLNLIDCLINLKNKGVLIKVDYVLANSSLLGDKDFIELWQKN